MKKLLLGNEAIARGLFESGCSVVSSYPGTPSTEITEYAAEYKEMFVEWAPNEKVAYEVALGAAIGGARAFTGLKHVGLNVAADPLFTSAYTGINAGMIIAVADDPGMHSSQNEQDSRYYAISAKLPMLEPADSEECLSYIKKAYEISEKFDTPVMIRLSTRVSHSQSLTNVGERTEIPNKPYVKNENKFVMIPAYARQRHTVVEQRLLDMADYADNSGINTVEYNNTKIGVITSGISWQYAKEALGDGVSYLKLGMVNPLPNVLIKDFCTKHEEVYVIEELDGIIENHVKALGYPVMGKERFPVTGELSAEIIKEKILNKSSDFQTFGETVPVRPPVMCPGCPHRGMFYSLKKLGYMVNGDIGCYALGQSPPLSAIDTTVCMGFSVSGIHGFNKATGSKKKSVGIIGDSTFIHSGITGLIDIAYNAGNSTVIILDNSITGMTGHQENPTTGKNIRGEAATAVNLELLCKAVGIEDIYTVDPYDIENVEKLLNKTSESDKPSVIIARRPCALLKTVKAKPALKISADKCKSCKMCLKIGCPSIKFVDGKASIDTTLCVGCELCTKLCKFDAIGKGGN